VPLRAHQASPPWRWSASSRTWPCGGVLLDPAAKALPLYVVLVGGGGPLVLSLTLKLVRREFGSDLLAAISIVAAVLLQEYLAGAVVVFMLSGGEALEAFARRRASQKSSWTTCASATN
jgi:cation transport ATPase